MDPSSINTNGQTSPALPGQQGTTVAGPNNTDAPSSPSTLVGVSDRGTQEQLKDRYVVEAMKVIEQNADDPYKQAQLIEKLKQGYLRDVYHRSIRLPDS